MKIYGEIYYNDKEKSWSGGGKGWWISDSEGKESAVVNFVESFSIDEPENYKISVSVLCGDCKFRVDEVTVHSFRIICENIKSELCGAAFTAQGEKSVHTYDDKNLTNEQSIADIYAAGLLLDHEAPYGFISIMGSASIVSSKNLKKREHSIEEKIARLEKGIKDKRVILSDKEIKRHIKLNKNRLERQGLIENKSEKYFTSAYEFGKLWGRYYRTEQKERLNGHHIPLCTGGGPGIMGAAAMGAREENAHVIGIDIPFGLDDVFDYTDSYSLYSDARLRMNNFAIREGVLVNYSHVILFWPGGFGTTWEVCETLSKLQTHHLRKRRIKAIFVHREFWQPFFDFMEHMREYGTINRYGDRIYIPGVDDKDDEDAYLAEVVDTPEEAFLKTKEFVEYLAKRDDLKLRDEQD